jgi:hypothetical protein
MSVALGLYAEFENANSRDEFFNRFPAQNFPTIMERTITWNIDRWEVSSCDAYIVGAESFDLPDQGIPNVLSAVEHTAIGFRLFHLLRDAADLKFARVGFEASAFSSCKLKDEVEKKSGVYFLKINDCIISNKLFQEIGRPTGLTKFNEFCYWTRWQGVSYEPLYDVSQVELRELVNQLFPNMYFEG